MVIDPKALCLQIIKEKQEFERVVVTHEEALSMFEENKFKAEIIDGLPQDATISLYRCGPMVRPFRDYLACLLSVWCTLLSLQEVAQ